MRGHRKQPHTTAVILTTFIIILFISTTTITPSPFVFVNSEDDLKDSPVDDPQSITDLEEFSEFDSKSDDKLDPGSWRPIFESDEADSDNTNPSLKEYYSNVRELVDGGRAMEEVASEIELMAASGNPHAQSLLGFLYSMGMARERNEAKAFMYHHLAADSGNPRSKLACAYTYYRQELYEKAVVLYAELAKVAVNSFLISKDYPAIELVRIYEGSEENKDALRKSSGEEDGGFQILKYQAKEYFEKAADNKESGYHYKMDIVYLRGNGMNEAFVCYYIKAAHAGHPIAIYQLAKMLHTGIGLRKNLSMATKLYKLVAETGPWSSLSRWALESYLKGEVGKAFLLYSRMAELGYEVAQSNAAWILDKFGEESMCMGESGLCTDAERHQRAHSLWWQASKQGNEQADLLIKDAYYDGQDFNDENTGSDSDTNYLQMKKSYKSSNDVQEFELVPMVCSTSYLEEPYKFSSGLINPRVISSKYGSLPFTSSKSDDNVGIVRMCKQMCTSPLLWSRDSAVVVPDATEVYWIMVPKADITKFVAPLVFSKYLGSASADTGMWNPSQMLKQCLTWETCIDMTKDLLQISVFPDVICLLKAHILNHVLRDHPNFDDEECIGDIILFKKGNATIPSLFVCLLTALYLHERQRRLAVAAPPLEPLPEEIIIIRRPWG